MMAAAATMFAACTQSDFVNEVSEEAPQAIGFENYVGKSTRAEINSEENLATEGGFVVWGYKTKTVDPVLWNGTNDIATIFDGVNVKGTKDNWTYDNKKYWDKTSSYNFYAVAPYQPESGTYSLLGENLSEKATNGYIKITGVKSAPAATSDDFLLARGGQKNVSGDYTVTHDKVSLNFNHIMSKVTLALACGGINTGDKITVTSLTMTGWNENDGVFTQSLDATPTVTNNIEEWNIATPSIAGNAAFTGPYNLTPGGENAEVGSYIMVPQSVAKLTFTLDYTITYKAGGTEDFVAHSGELTAQTWGTDTHTTYTITVGPAPIEFEVNTVNGFTNSPTPQPGLSIQ